MAFAPAAVLLQPVTVQIGAAQAGMQYAGPAPGMIDGVLRIDARVPGGVSGTVPVMVTAGGAGSPPASMAVR